MFLASSTVLYLGLGHNDAIHMVCDCVGKLAFRSAHLKNAQLHTIVLVGGNSSHYVAIISLLASCYPKSSVGGYAVRYQINVNNWLCCDATLVP
jgi:hypothetical protein